MTEGLAAFGPASGSQARLSGPLLETSHIRLRILYPSDYPFLYQLSMAPETGFRWRFRARQMNYEEFVGSMGNGVFAQFVVESKTTRERLGLVVCYQANIANQFAYLGVLGSNTAQLDGRMIEGTRLFIEYLFRSFSFRKLYLETPEFNLDPFLSGKGSFFVEEGILREHELHMERWWDLYIFALYRDTWSKRLDGVSERARAAGVVDSLGGSRMDFRSFCDFLSASLEIADGIDLSSSIPFEQLGLDSLQIYEAVVAIEETGVILSDEGLQNVHSVRDLHFQYLQADTS
jgi:RimJ/RimL family protein N-acetyltransferase/acyl carrier protein